MLRAPQLVDECHQADRTGQEGLAPRACGVQPGLKIIAFGEKDDRRDGAQRLDLAPGIGPNRLQSSMKVPGGALRAALAMTPMLTNVLALKP
jgi:hypothetical protein